MNQILAAEAERRVKTGEGGPLEPGLCQAWARRTVIAVHGSLCDPYWRASARLTGLAFRAAASARALPAGVTVIDSSQARDTQIGDLLYALYLPHGHVSIRVSGNRVAENSTTSIGRVNGAVGYRPIASVRWDMIVRLAEPVETADVQPDDVSAWAKAAVAYCRQHGLMSGYPDGAFRGTAPVTREELAIVAMRLHQEVRR